MRTQLLNSIDKLLVELLCPWHTMWMFLAEAWGEMGMGFTRRELLCWSVFVNVLLQNMLPYILKLTEAYRLDQITTRATCNSFHNTFFTVMLRQHWEEWKQKLEQKAIEFDDMMKTKAWEGGDTYRWQEGPFQHQVSGKSASVITRSNMLLFSLSMSRAFFESVVFVTGIYINQTSSSFHTLFMHVQK